MAYVGETIRDSFSLVSTSNVPITGATFVVELNLDPDGAANAVTITEKGAGVYEVSFPVAKTGQHVIQVASVTVPVQRFLIEEYVYPASPTPGPITGPDASGATLNDLIRVVAIRLGDHQELTATSNGALNGSTFVDTLNLAAIQANAFKGAELYMTTVGNAANLGKSVRVLTSSPVDGTLALTPSLPAQVVTGDVAELVNLEGKGYTRQRIRNALNAAIQSAGTGTLVPISQIVLDPYSAQQTYLDIPPAFTHLYRVEHETSPDVWAEVPQSYANNVGHTGWSVDQATGSLYISGYERNWANGHTVRLYGYGRPSTLTAGTDVTILDQEWLVSTACHYLTLSRGDPRTMQVASMFKNEADLLRAKIMTQMEPNTVRVR